MKIAIASSGKTIDSMVDERFGRAAYFAVYDDKYESRGITIIKKILAK